MDHLKVRISTAKLNYAENLLRYADDSKIALYHTSERIRQIGVGRRTFGELKVNVARIAASLRAVGVTVGDRVAGYLPNCPEAIEVMAACGKYLLLLTCDRLSFFSFLTFIGSFAASIGAVWSSTSPDFGVNGVLDRYTTF